MGGLQAMEVGLMDPDRLLQLLDVLCPTLSEGSLGLAITLFTFL